MRKETEYVTAAERLLSCYTFTLISNITYNTPAHNRRSFVSLYQVELEIVEDLEALSKFIS